MTMIDLINVSKSMGDGRRRIEVLSDVSATFPSGRKIGLLAASGGGKTTVLRMLSRLDAPDRGAIRSSGALCWPLTYGAFIERNATFLQNAYILSHLYGVDGDEIADAAAEICGVRIEKSKALKRYTQHERRFIALGLTLALQFDWYFVDDLLPPPPTGNVGDLDAVIGDRFSRASVIWSTSNPAFVAGFCDAGAVLHRGKLRVYDTFEEAAERYHAVVGYEGSKQT